MVMCYTICATTKAEENMLSQSLRWCYAHLVWYRRALIVLNTATTAQVHIAVPTGNVNTFL